MTFEVLSVNSVLKALNAFAIEVFSISEKSDLSWYVAREVVAKMGFADCVIYYADLHRRELNQVAAIGSKNPKDRVIKNALTIPFGNGITGGVAASGEACIVKDLAEDSRYIPDIEPAQSEICVPFFSGGKVAGVIDCEDPRPNAFDGFHLQTLTTVAAMLGSKLDRIHEAEAISEKTAALEKSQEVLFEGIGALPVGFAYFDANYELVLFNQNFPSLLPRSAHLIKPGVSFETLVRNSAHVVAPLAGYDDVEDYVREKIKATRLEGRSWLHKQSTGGWVLMTEKPTTSGGFISIIQDVTEQKLTEESLRASNRQRKAALHVARMASWAVDADSHLEWSPELFEMLAIDPAEFNNTSAEFYDLVHPEDRARVSETTRQAWENLSRYECVHRIYTGEGDLLTVRESAEIVTDENGAPAKIIGALQDITETVQLEAQLQQAQKMEAVGQLTGGVAHDFNNILAVILGNAELLEELGAEASPFAAAIIRASKRGAELTQRLLAFSRQQPLNPVAIDLYDLVSELADLLQRTLGETIDIKTIPCEDVWLANADQGQVENALLNLAINSRDAMPNGGELTIEYTNLSLDHDSAAKLSNLSVGDYVVLSVTDHGTGMSKETQSHAFEPFYTTKETGQGSGLGLSMVYGFAQQSGGQATIDSELGMGTTVKLYLPRALAEADRIEKPQKEAVPRGNGETILVIEDDPQVRQLAEMMLMNLGYKVVSAENIDAARQTVEAHPEIALVLSDVVLPGGTSGPEFADELRAMHPDLTTIFMSGYPAEAAKRNGFLGSDRVLLNKPFRVAELAKAVSEMLA